MQHVKIHCDGCPPLKDHPLNVTPKDWETHPSWIAGMEALNAYGDWVSSFVMPIAFQWIEEHKPDVYATVPEDLKDDVGVVIASAFRLVKDLSAYKNGMIKSAAYSEAMASGTWDPSKTNPVWTSIAREIRTETKEAFEKYASLLGDTSK